MLVEKPAFPRIDEYQAAIDARNLRSAWCSWARTIITSRCSGPAEAGRQGAIGEMVFAHFTTIVKRLKRRTTGATTRAMAGGDAFFEEGIHWLHIAGSLGAGKHHDSGVSPDAVARRPRPARQEHDGRLPLRQRRRGLLLLFARDAVAVPRPSPVEAVRPPGRHHVRVERALHPGERRWLSASGLSRFP